MDCACSLPPTWPRPSAIAPSMWTPPRTAPRWFSGSLLALNTPPPYVWGRWPGAFHARAVSVKRDGRRGSLALDSGAAMRRSNAVVRVRRWLHLPARDLCMECAICGLSHFAVTSRATRDRLEIPDSTTRRVAEGSMNVSGALLTGLVACFLVTPAFAQEGSHTTSASRSAAARKPAPEMNRLKPLIGSWACSGEAFASPFGPAHPTTGTQTFTPALGGFWVVVRNAEDKTPQNPAPLRSVAAITYILRRRSSSPSRLTIWADTRLRSPVP